MGQDMSTTIGILGGMGPLATVDFMSKIIQQTPAETDQQHLPLLVHSIPQIPDRTANLLHNSPSPLSALKAGVKTLVEAKVGCIAIPCNTAHHWYQPLTDISPVPILHIARACSESLAAEGHHQVGLLATDGTLKAGFYRQELANFSIGVKEPTKELQQKVMEAIYLVKSGAVEQGGYMLEHCMDAMLEQGVERVILGCTEIPFALDRIGSTRNSWGMDATHELASACVQWYLSEQCKAA